MKLDPITLEILATKVAAISEEMGIVLQRAGRTIYVKETEDLGTGLMTPEGRMFAHPPAGSIGVANMLDNDAAVVIARIGDLEPGDVVITNDPYSSGGLATHLPDIHMIRPYFGDDGIVCFGWCFIHSADVGGKVPSSISPSNNEIYQEGLIIRPTKIVKAGKINEDVLEFIRANCRTAEANVGDLRAMLAALSVGETRVAEMIAEHGDANVRALPTDVIEYSAARARDAFRTISDGTYRFADYLDDDYNSPLPVRLEATMTVKDGELAFDFAGTDPQVASAYNLPSAGRRHSRLSIRLLHYALSRDASIPMNAGIFESIHFDVPIGSVLNPVMPAAVGVRHATGNRINDLMSGLLVHAVPDFMRAAGSGVLVPIVLAEPMDEDGTRKVDVVEPMTGGSGAAKGLDGVDGRECSVSGMSNNPVESVEASAAVTVLRYGIRPDSGGPGEWRGGAGLELTFRPHRAGSHVLGRGLERFRFAPWGVFGGHPGERARVVRNYGRPNEEDLGKIDMIEVGEGDTITILTPGGGGYGDPFARDVSRVAADVRRGVVTEAGAKADYGVIISNGIIDAEATVNCRASRQNGEEPPFLSLGLSREVWDAVFDEELVEQVRSALAAAPVSRRSDVWQQLMMPVSSKITGVVDLTLPMMADAAQQLRKRLAGPA